MSDLEKTVAALAAKVAELEDRLAIYQLVSTYGPAVDGDARDVAAGLWTTDGVYDSGMTGQAPFRGSAEVGAMVDGDMHQGIIAGGSAHIMAMPHIEIHGDQAVATGYSQLVLYDKQQAGFRVWRTGANRWECARTPEGWRVTSRVLRNLDGSAEPRGLFRAGVDPGYQRGE